METPMPANDELYLIADELRAIANMGIRFAENSYDTERYERVRTASARIVASLERRSPDEVLERYDDNLAQVTPQTGSSAAVVREGRILLIRREDNGLWALPGGMAEVGETPSEAAVRELSEEANVEGRATRLLALVDSRLWRSRSKTHFYLRSSWWRSRARNRPRVRRPQALASSPRAICLPCRPATTWPFPWSSSSSAERSRPRTSTRARLRLSGRQVCRYPMG